MHKPAIEDAGKPASDNFQRSLRRALGSYPTGVAIVSALTEKRQPAGMTINSFASVSLSPPLICWCIDRQAATYEIFSRAAEFALTVLSAEQAGLAARFATRGANKFRDIDVYHDRPPLIPGGCAWFRCENSRSLLLGDHRMLIGRVIDFGCNTNTPLVFSNGNFQRLARVVEIADPGEGPIRDDGKNSHFRESGDLLTRLHSGAPAHAAMTR